MRYVQRADGAPGEHACLRDPDRRADHQVGVEDDYHSRLWVPVLEPVLDGRRLVVRRVVIARHRVYSPVGVPVRRVGGVAPLRAQVLAGPRLLVARHQASERRVGEARLVVRLDVRVREAERLPVEVRRALGGEDDVNIVLGVRVGLERRRRRCSARRERQGKREHERGPRAPGVPPARSRAHRRPRAGPPPRARERASVRAQRLRPPPPAARAARCGPLPAPRPLARAVRGVAGGAIRPGSGRTEPTFPPFLSPLPFEFRPG